MRLSKQQLAEHRSWLQHWRSPDEMLVYLHEVRKFLRSPPARTTGLWKQAGLAFVRDAHAIASMARSVRADRVRLDPTEWPDAEIEIAGKVRHIEIVEADQPGRHRGEENWKPGEVRMGSFPADQVPLALQTAVADKVARNYSERRDLLVYLNVGGHDEIVESFASSTTHGRDRFEKIWILWQSRVYEVWSDGVVTMVEFSASD